MPNFRALLLIVSTLSTVAHASLRVDINAATDRRDVLTSGWENWKIADGPSATQKFGDITVTLRAPGSAVTGTMNKYGLDTGATMATDGATAKSGPLELVISGLSPGKHTLVTYHNLLAEGATARYSISLDGKAVKEVTPSAHATSDEDVASAFIEFDAQSGKDIVVTIKPESGAIILNGFAIDVVDPTSAARKPIPATGDEHVEEGTILRWTPGKSVSTHNVYFGASADAVANATESSPEFKGAQKDPQFQPSNLNTSQTYYWRIDEVAQDKSATKGDVWRFRLRHLAFPGAEGYGRFALGGRAGKVYEVTTLEDSGPGSLREAVEAEGPRTVIFRVGGTIVLKDKIVVRNPYITVAGQTAPGDGICIRGATFGNLSTHDSIIRYVRVRVGDESGKTYDGMGFAYTDHSIIDHCSISWTIDESVSSRQAKNITFQRNLIA